MGALPIPATLSYRINTKQKEVKIIKQISKQGIEKLLKDGIIRHTHRGYVNPKNGEHIGFYKTVHKKYIEDYYADLVMKQVFAYGKNFL